MAGTDRRKRRGFRALSHTADKSIEAWGDSLPRLFAAAAEGMFSESERLGAIPRVQEWAIELEADAPEDLLHAWLAELLWLSERDEAVPCEFDVQELTEQPWRLRAHIRGGPAPRETPHTGAPIKAVTYHDLHIWRDEAGTWHARVVFDV